MMMMMIVTMMTSCMTLVSYDVNFEKLAIFICLKKKANYTKIAMEISITCKK